MCIDIGNLLAITLYITLHITLFSVIKLHYTKFPHYSVTQQLWFMPIWGDGIFGHAGIHGGPYGVAG